VAKITREDVRYVAGLAQLAVDAETEERLVRELGDILSFMDKLNELDTDGVEPMMHVMEVTNVFRDDELGASLDRDTALKNAPKTDGEYFVVPRILEME
jgi:aspartyl-tRNA(Asn)/glutamyl-tRNA(Gln) amidotransferase subunit C